MDTELMIACLDVPGVGVIVCPSGQGNCTHIY